MSDVKEQTVSLKRLVYQAIESACGRKGVSFRVLHGVDGNRIGRDVDVWVEACDLTNMAVAVREATDSLGLGMVRINSLYGQRFLVFSDEVEECGLFEFHCVRSLRWFWAGNPTVPDVAPTWKRLVLPLLSLDCLKADAELRRHPLSGKELLILRENIRSMGLLANSETESFFSAIEQGNMKSAAHVLRHGMVLRAWRHPLGLATFCASRILSPFWLFVKPCGPIIVVEDHKTAQAVKDQIEPRKGILTQVDVFDCSRTSVLFLPLRLLYVRTFRQGRQRATILILPAKNAKRICFLVSPLFWDGSGDIVSSVALTMKNMVAATNIQP